RRLAFENLLLYRLAVRLAGPAGQSGPAMKQGAFDPEAFWEKLPFAPTGAQRKALLEIIADLEGGYAMRRLVQGDVGSGKTAVALGAAACVIASGYQCAFMAPTDLLAHQHMKTAEALLRPFGIRCGLLTGSMGAREKRAALENILSGEWQLVIGTHALISKGVGYQNLGLAVTDEQHRFGVRQRQTLADRTQGEGAAHILALSATPIPRTLYMALYADMRVSVMDEMPPGRKPVKTRIVPESKRDGLYAYVREKAQQGEQSFLVCPLVEDSEENEAQSAQGLHGQLVKGPLSGVPVGLIWGSQDARAQEEALAAFYAGETAVLVSTTVIEVGMDVPGATTMVVEDADRFGLAQLHQLRGRVGRGDKESWCFLLGEPNERLTALAGTNDGFIIAQKDLELRGPGEFLGTRQHGHVIDPYGMGDARLLEETRQCLEDVASRGEDSPEYAMLKLVAERKYLHRLQGAAMH
ncbi:MAG TPA: ATP-dependent DNA helicase RecG, partial [Candidatus Limnocylindria bacterium]|nr:ATP-dependent DNA helicase RecG [Candidatus Limnocylindria bacterium]